MKHLLRNAHTHAWKRWGVLPLLLSIVLTFVIVATVSAAAIITATKTYTFIGGDGDTKADPGETIEYTVTIANGSLVPGADDATGVNFTDTIDPHTTLVPGSLVVSPLALDETYSSVGNMTLTSSAIDPTCGGNPLRSVTCNDLMNGSTLVGFGATQPTANGTVVNGSNTVTTSNSGTVLLNTDGTFVYDPAAGFEGADGFWYTLSNSAGNDNAHVTINVGGANGMVWFISSAGGGGGRQANPFTLAAFNTANTGVGTNPADGDTVFLFEGAHTGPVTLRNNQKFIGQDATVSVQTLGGPTAQPGNAYPAINPTGATVAITSAGIGVTLGSGNNVAGLTVGNATTAMNGGAVGTLKVREVTINTNGSGLIISTSGTITTDATFTGFTGITTTGGTNGISLTGVGGTLNTGGSLSGASGATFNVSGGTVSSTYSGSVTQGNNAPMVSIAGGHSGTITFQTGTLNATNGTGLQFSDADGIYNFNGTTTLNGGDAGVDILTGSSGTFSFSSSTSITSPTGTAFNVTGATNNPTVTYSGSITQNNAQRVVNIDGTTSNTITFNTGAVTGGASSTGININNANGNVSFANLTLGTSGSRINNQAVTITNGTGTYSLGAVSIFTNNVQGIAATNADGTINSTSGTVDAGNGTAINIDGPAGLTTLGMMLTRVDSDDAGGSATGIIVQDTSGSFIVNGDGSNTAVGGNSSGGVISGKSGADGSTSTGNGIYLSNASGVTLRRMTINGTNQNHGIRGVNSSNFTLEYSTVSGTNGTDLATDEGSVNFDNLTVSAAIIGCIIEGGLEDNLNVVNTSGTLNRLTITDTTFGFNNTVSGNNNILIEAQNAGTTLNFTLQSSLIKGARADWLNASNNSSSTMDAIVGGSTPALGNTFDNLGANAHPGAAPGGNRVVFGAVGVQTVDIRNNTLKGSKGEAIRVRSTASGTTTGTVDARVRNNTIGVAAIANSGSSEGSGIFVFVDGGGDMDIAVTDNQIFQYNNQGIRLQDGDEINDGSVFNATVTGNTVNTPGNINSDFNGINLNNGTIGATDNFVSCIDIGGAGALANNIVGSGNGTNPPNNQEFRLQQRQSTTVRLPGYGGANNDNAAVVAYIQGRNTVTGGNGAASNTVPTGGGFIGGAACTPPSFAFAPNNNLAFAQHQADGYPMAYAHASNTDTNSATAFTPAFDLGSMFKLTSWVAPQDESVTPAAALRAGNQGKGSKQITPRLAPPTAPALSGETVTVPAFTLPAGKTVTIKYRVTVDPLGPGEIRTRILNQSTVSGSNFSNVTTTDPAPSADPACTAAPAIGTQTCTPVDRPDTTVVSINRASGNPNSNPTVTWQVVFADPIDGLTAGNFTLVNTGLGGTPAITGVTATSATPATTWNITASTGSGQGTLGLNMVNDAGLSHDVTNVSFTGQVYDIDHVAPTTISFTRQTPATNPTNADTLVFHVTFSEQVTGVGAADFAVTGTTATVTSISAGGPSGPYDVTVSGGDLASFNGVVGLNFSGTLDITDLAGNPVANTEPAIDETYTLDNTAPTTVSFTRQTPATSPTNADTLIFRVTFSEQVTGVGTADFAVTGTTATATSISAGGPSGPYDVTVSGGDLASFNGVVGLNFSGALNITDLVGNAVANTEPATDETYTVDNTAPTATIDQVAGQSDPTNISPINFTAVFNEPVTGFSGADVTLAGTAGATSAVVTEIAPNDGTTYTVAVSGMTTDGTVSASIPLGGVQDAAGNGNAASTSTDNTVTYDTTAPTVTIDQAAGQADPTNTSPINFAVVFSESVTGFGAGDVTVGGTAGATTDTVTEIAPNDGTTYAVAISGMTTDGTVIASIPPGAAQDTAGNGNTASTSTDNTVTFDATVPTVTMSSAAPDPTNTSPIPVTVQFSETVTGFVVGDITPGNGTVGNFVTVDGDTYTFDLTPSAQGLVTADIAAGVAQDTTGNDNTAATQFSRTYDTAAPTVAMSSAAPDPTNTSPIPVTVQFSETVTGFVVGDITPGNGTVGNFVAVDGDTYTFDLTPSAQGLVTADIAAGVATDASGNGNTAASQFSRTYDTVGPTVTIDQAAGQVDPTGTAPINFAVVFSESVTGFGGLDVNLSGTAGATTAVVTEIAPMDGTTYNVAVSGMSLSGTVIASIPAGAAQDAATNGNTASTSTDNTVTFDPVFPVVTGIVRADPSPTNATSVRYTVTFSKNVVSGVDASDFTFTTSGVSGAAIVDITGGGTTWTVTVSTGTGDGTLRLDLVDDDTIVDIAGNQLGGTGAGNGNFTTGEVYVIDKTGPSVVSIVRATASPTNAATVDFTMTFGESVTGVDAGDFSLATGGVTGAAIVNIAGSGTTWTATVSTGSGSGTIGLNLIDDDTIVDQVGNALGGTGAGNGNFTGEVYTIDKTAPQAGSLVAANITTGGGATQTFTVVFSDNLAIDIASLDGTDIRVTGPGGFNQLAALVSVTPATNGTPRTATYRISAPGGSWDNADNGAYTVALQANQVGDTAGNPVAASVLGTFSVNVSVSRRTVFLPLIFQSVAQAPDLVVTSVTLSPNKTSFTTSEPVQISVVIKNQGNAPTTPFWVDLYLNPSHTPTLNLIWSQVCSLSPCYGIAWQVTQPLAPGAELTLTSTVGSFAQGYSNWRERLAAGTTDLYVQADSWNPGKSIGASDDTNLANNLFHMSGLHVTGQNVAAAEADVAIPARPAAGQR